MTPYSEALERQDPQERERSLERRLPAIIDAALQTPGWADILRGVRSADIRSRTDLQALPITRKLDLITLQKQRPPLGGIYGDPASGLQRIFMSPGPIFEAQGRQSDWWQTARPLNAAGLQPGHILQNCFSYHLTPGAFLIDEGARALGATVIPAGPGQTEQQLNALETLKADAYAGTPSFLKHIITCARESGRDIRSLKMALVSGEPLPDTLRQWLRDHGVARVLQFYGTADVGAIAYETADPSGDVFPGMIVNENLILEIIDPESGKPVGEGETGEVVITLMNPDYPLVRFGTGDLSTALPGHSPCGRTNMRIAGWQGRADDLIKVRGMFIHPGDIKKIAQRHLFIQQLHLVVDNDTGSDRMTLHCVIKKTHETPNDVAAVLATTFRELTRLRADIHLVESLPDDQPIITDVRTHH